MEENYNSVEIDDLIETIIVQGRIIRELQKNFLELAKRVQVLEEAP